MRRNLPAAHWVEMCVIRAERQGCPFPLYSWRMLASDGRAMDWGSERSIPELMRWSFEVETFLEVWTGVSP